MSTAGSEFELRVVLLGNSWKQRCAVGNLLLTGNVFQEDDEPDFQRVKGRYRKTDLIAITNTPDILSAKTPEDKQKRLLQRCDKFTEPGPHMFLLVLQPEDFTEEQKWRLCRVLQHFGDRWFDHSLVIVPTPKEGPNVEASYINNPDLQAVISMCGDRHLMQENLQFQDLLARMDQIVKENKRVHLSSERSKDATSGLTTRMESSTSHQYHDLRIVLLGKSDEKKTTLRNLILGQREFQALRTFANKQCEEASGGWGGKRCKVVKIPDLFSLSVETARQEIGRCVSLCPPGPNVLLLLVKPSEFTEENRETLKFLLSLFGPDAFKHSVVISTHEDGQTDETFRRLLRDCGERHYSMSEDNRSSLMSKIENIEYVRRGTFLTFDKDPKKQKSEDTKPALNLVLCGRRGAGKSSAAEAILGQTGLHSASTSSECVQHQGEVCGRLVSLVDLPALSEKPLETVMKESLRSVSLCDPEGVHAFILFLPVDPLTEDKKELKIIQDVFGSRVNDFTMILFTIESDSIPAIHRAVVDNLIATADIQELVQSCGGRYFVLNFKDQRQIQEFFISLEQKPLGFDKPSSYTTETFAHVQIDKLNTLQAELQDLKPKETTRCNDEMQSSDHLRIVLIGKTGCGKSSSGNTILGKKEFKAESSQISVTKCCTKVDGEVDGRRISVVDTPGLFDTTFSHEKIQEETVKCFSLLAPGPHVFLLVLKIGRFTEEDRKALGLIKKFFGPDAEKFTIVLLTEGDKIQHEDTSVEEYIEKKCTESFKELISDCGGRYHVFNNYDRENREQVSELMTKINTMVRTNGGSCFTNEMLQGTEAAIRKEMEELMKEKEEMKREREELQRKHEEEIRQIKTQEREKQESREMEERMKEQRRKEEEEWGRKQEERERMERGQKFADLEKQLQAEREENERLRKEKERQNAERKREGEEFWKDRFRENEQIRYEEQTKLKKLQEEMDNLKKTHEEETRKRAEEFQVFREKNRKDLLAQMIKHDKQMKEKDAKYEELKIEAARNEEQMKNTYKTELYSSVKCVTKNREKINTLLRAHKKEMKAKEGKINLKEIHEKQMADLVHDLMCDVDASNCQIL